MQFPSSYFYTTTISRRHGYKYVKYKPPRSIVSQSIQTITNLLSPLTHTTRTITTSGYYPPHTNHCHSTQPQRLIINYHRMFHTSQHHQHHQNHAQKHSFHRYQSTHSPILKVRSQSSQNSHHITISKRFRQQQDRPEPTQAQVNFARNRMKTMSDETRMNDEQFQRPDQIDPENYKAPSRNLLPEQMRGTSGFVFRKGLNVPRLNSNHWLNTMILEPYMALKGNSLVWWDTNVRFTPRGFLLLHFVSLISAIFIGYHAPKLFWIDYHDNMDRSKHLYMIDVAKLLWLQQTIRNCELMIQKRPNGVVPGVVLRDVIQEERELPFKTAATRKRTDLLDRWKEQQENAKEKQLEEQKRKFRYETWGNKLPSEVEEDSYNKKRRDLTYQEKRGSMREYSSTLQDTKDEIRANLNQEKKGFRNKYVQPYINVAGNTSFTPTPSNPSNINNNTNNGNK